MVRFNRPAAFGAGGAVAVRRKSGPSPALVKAQAALSVARKGAAKARANMGGKGGNLEAAGATLAGGAIAGVLKAKLPLVPVLNIDSRIVATVVFVAAGMFGVKGRIGGLLVNAGAGIGATVLSDKVEDMLDGDE
jgi:hypothetical protein